MEILKDPAAGVNVLNALPKVQVKYLATQQKPLDAHPTMPGVVKWFLRRVYDYYGFAATDHNGRAYCSVEHRGVFDHEGDARWAANCEGGAYKAIPYNEALPEETCQFGVHDFPQSEASPGYRKRRLQFVAIARTELEQIGLIEAKIEQVVKNASA